MACPFSFALPGVVMFSRPMPLKREVTTILEETTVSIHKRLKTLRKSMRTERASI